MKKILIFCIVVIIITHLLPNYGNNVVKWGLYENMYQ